MGKIPDVVVHVFEVQFGALAVLNVHDGMNDVTCEQAARAESV